MKCLLINPENIVVFDRQLWGNKSRLGKRTSTYQFSTELLEKSESVDCVPVASTHPLYILYNFTTGKPKGVIRDTGGYATALKFL